MNLELRLRSIPCDDEGCPTVLGGPTHPDLCEDCAGLFEQQGIATHDEQLELSVRGSTDPAAGSIDPAEVEIGEKAA